MTSNAAETDFNRGEVVTVLKLHDDTARWISNYNKDESLYEVRGKQRPALVVSDMSRNREYEAFCFTHVCPESTNPDFLHDSTGKLRTFNNRHGLTCESYLEIFPKRTFHASLMGIKKGYTFPKVFVDDVIKEHNMRGLGFTK